MSDTTVGLVDWQRAVLRSTVSLAGCIYSLNSFFLNLSSRPKRCQFLARNLNSLFAFFVHCTSKCELTVFLVYWRFYHNIVFFTALSTSTCLLLKKKGKKKIKFFQIFDHFLQCKLGVHS